MHTNEIASKLGVEPRAYGALQTLLDDLAFDGTLSRLSGQRFRVSKKAREARGAELIGTLNVNPRGFGFVSVPGAPDDLYIAAEGMRGAMHGDTVKARAITRSHRGVEGEIVEVMARRLTRVAGTIARRGRLVCLEPDDARVRGPIVLRAPESLADANGKAAVITIARYPEEWNETPEGDVLSVLGAPGEPNVEAAKVLLRHAIIEEHPEDAVAEANAFGGEVPASALEGREDLTHLPLPTIDPEDARDHDDAVWVVRRDDGSYTAWIAIADVSSYVTPGSALDRAALERGCSIYLPDRAIPMLPRALSSNLCSLLPGVKRLCLCVEVELDAAGVVLRSRVIEGVMVSRAKLHYPGVARALGFTPEPERQPEAEEMRDDLRVMWDLSRQLRARRMRRGALDFDLPEAKVVLDPATGAPTAITESRVDPGVVKAYQLIEELMLLANEVVARLCIERNLPALFRNHATPDEAKLDRFATLCAELGVPFEIEDALDPKKLSQLLKKIAVRPDKQVLHQLLLRAMKQAAYDVANIGHFGLASPAYLHFTSPIRRYPDLVVHRAVRAHLRGEPPAPVSEALRFAAARSSENERRAAEIEREIDDLYRALYMRDKIGSIYEGRVSGLSATGLYVAVPDPFIDVFVRAEALGSDRYEMDDEGLRFVATRSGDRIALGERMVVAIEDVSIERRTVFGKRLLDDDAPRPRKQRRVKQTKETIVRGRKTKLGKRGKRR